MSLSSAKKANPVTPMRMVRFPVDSAANDTPTKLSSLADSNTAILSFPLLSIQSLALDFNPTCKGRPALVTPESGNTGYTAVDAGLGSTFPIKDHNSGLQRHGGTDSRVRKKANTVFACNPCKRAHLACDVGRPCGRCIRTGKELQCEDVPQKKRGRPKILKTNQCKRQTLQTRPYATMVRVPREPTPPVTEFVPKSPLFTVFTTTGFRILKCTPTSHSLTGFAPQDFIDTYLLDWVSPNERHLVEIAHGRLMVDTLNFGQLHTDLDAQDAIRSGSEQTLLTPIDGMREPYPNQNVRILRADRHYSIFNVRLHLGGGLGGSLRHPDTLGRMYFVISLLLVPESPSPLPAPPDDLFRGPRQRYERNPDVVTCPKQSIGLNHSPDTLQECTNRISVGHRLTSR